MSSSSRNWGCLEWVLLFLWDLLQCALLLNVVELLDDRELLVVLFQLAHEVPGRLWVLLLFKFLQLLRCIEFNKELLRLKLLRCCPCFFFKYFSLNGFSKTVSPATFVFRGASFFFRCSYHLVRVFLWRV